MNIGLAIKKIRKDRDISQGQLAVLCEISQTSLSQIEKGIKRASSKNMEKICKVLDIPEAILYFYSIEETDIPDKKKELFNTVFPAIEDMVKKLLLNEK